MSWRRMCCLLVEDGTYGCVACPQDDRAGVRPRLNESCIEAVRRPSSERDSGSCRRSQRYGRAQGIRRRANRVAGSGTRSAVENDRGTVSGCDVSAVDQDGRCGSYQPVAATLWRVGIQSFVVNRKRRKQLRNVLIAGAGRTWRVRQNQWAANGCGCGSNRSVGVRSLRSDNCSRIAVAGLISGDDSAILCAGSCPRVAVVRDRKLIRFGSEPDNRIGHIPHGRRSRIGSNREELSALG